MQDGGLVADNAVTPLQPARNRAVSPAAICGPTLRGDAAAQRDVPPRLKPDRQGRRGRPLSFALAIDRRKTRFGSMPLYASVCMRSETGTCLARATAHCL
jgi:hypothetical protein